MRGAFRPGVDGDGDGSDGGNELTPTLTAFLRAHSAVGDIREDYRWGAPLYSCSVQDKDGHHSEAIDHATVDDAVHAAIEGYWQEVNRAGREHASYLAEVKDSYATTRGV
jgi:hypothetical protein